jgi:hypothetical protein
LIPCGLGLVKGAQTFGKASATIHAYRWTFSKDVKGQYNELSGHYPFDLLVLRGEALAVG